MDLNIFKTAFFLTLLTILFIFIGYSIAGPNGAFIAFLFAVFFNFGSYWYSDKIVLTLYKARELKEYEVPGLFAIVRELTNRADLPMPKICIVPRETPNVFATGRDPAHSAIVVTEGILETLDEEELKGVVAHEISHIKHRDTLISTIAATLAGAITMLASWARWIAIFGGFGGDDDGGGIIGILIISIIAPIAAIIIQLAISRSREYSADKSGAELSHNPLYLADALEKLHNSFNSGKSKVNPSTAHLFIVNPINKKQFFSTLFNTHPPVEERVRRLRGMAGVEY